MVEYECYKCKKKFNKKSTYEYHINRKYSCIIEEREIKKDKIQELEEKIIEIQEQMKQLLQKKDETIV